MPTSILVISNHGHIVGGGEMSLLDLLGGLDRRRWASVLVVPEEGGVASGARDLGLPVHVVPLPTLRHPGPRAVRSVGALAPCAGSVTPLDAGTRTPPAAQAFPLIPHA